MSGAACDTATMLEVMRQRQGPYGNGKDHGHAPLAVGMQSPRHVARPSLVLSFSHSHSLFHLSTPLPRSLPPSFPLFLSLPPSQTHSAPKRRRRRDKKMQVSGEDRVSDRRKPWHVASRCTIVIASASCPCAAAAHRLAQHLLPRPASACRASACSSLLVVSRLLSCLH